MSEFGLGQEIGVVWNQGRRGETLTRTLVGETSRLSIFVSSHLFLSNPEARSYTKEMCPDRTIFEMRV